MFSPHIYAEGKQNWLEYVGAALKDAIETLTKEILAKPADERDYDQYHDECRALSRRIEENRLALREHRELMLVVKDYDVRNRQRAGWP